MPETVSASPTNPAGATGQEVIIVSGLPRSGTSMMMKMLAAGGIPPLTDEIRRADNDNPEGYYEFERVKKLPQGDVAWLPDADGKAVKVISALLPHLPDTHRYRLIFMERRLNEVLASQGKMLVRRGQTAAAGDDEKMAVVFERHLQQTKSQLAQRPNVAVLYLLYHEVLAAPERAAQRVADFLERGLDVAQMVAAVNAQLYRNRG